MTAGHTAGPWEIAKDGLVVNGIAVMAGDYGIAKVWDVEAGKAEENRANARLISAAPDMQEALVQAETIMSMLGVQDYMQEDMMWRTTGLTVGQIRLALAATRAALAKAKASPTTPPDRTVRGQDQDGRGGR